MKLSVIIPLYNEADTIRELLDKVSRVDLEKEIIIVDDASTDGSKKILKTLGQDKKIIYHSQNLGKGASLRTGLKYATGDIIITQDADLELDPQEYPRLIQPIVEGNSKVVYGSRFARKVKGLSFFSYFGNKVVTAATNLLYGTRLTDQATGYKVFATEVVKGIALECMGFEFCSEITAKLSRLGYQIVEVPISYIPRAKKTGKKVSWKDGFTALRVLLKYRFTNVDKMVLNHLSDNELGCS